MAEALEDGLAKEATSPPKKKSLFTKSTWGKPAEQKEGIDFFSRAEELWPSRLAEDERKRQKKAIKLERKRSTASAERKPSSTPDSKRRRLSQNGLERHSSEDSLNHDLDEASWTRTQVTPIAYVNRILTPSRGSTLSTPNSRKSHSFSSRQKPQASPVSLAERYSRDIHEQKKEMPRNNAAVKGYISLSDSDNEAGNVLQEISNLESRPINLDDDDDDVLSIPPPKPVVRIEEDPDMSDEEFPELAMEARQREKQKALDRLKAGQSFENQNHDTDGSNTPIHVVDDIFEERSSMSEDPVVEIFVTSWIEGTNALMVRRKLSQKLREVRLIWCDKQSISGQPIPKAVKDSIFLTWRGKRLYDLTNCRSLGLKIDGNGHLFSDGEGFMDGKVHFEAWTPDLYDHHQRKLAAKQDHDNDDDEPEEVVEHTVEKIKIIMKAKGMEPVKLQVRPTTTFHKMAIAFREQRDIPEGKDLALYFDGDKLDPDSKVEDTELAEMDNVEVHIR